MYTNLNGQPSNFPNLDNFGNIKMEENKRDKVSNGITEEEFHKLKGVKGQLKGKATAEIQVYQEHLKDKSLIEYLKLPASSYSTNVMKGATKRIERVSET